VGLAYGFWSTRWISWDRDRKEREEGRRQILKEKKEELEIRAREIAVSFAGHDTRPIRVYGTSIWDESLYKVRKILRVHAFLYSG
jgi:hypothetical protein